MTSPAPSLRTIGILGVGRVGAAVARQALKAGFDVKIATAKPAEEIALLADIVIPGARPVDATEAVSADLVVIAVPLHKFRTLDPQLLHGKTAIDVMNYWAPIDGKITEFESDPRTTSEIIQEFLEGATLVKSLNHIGYHELEEDDLPPGSTDRRALALAGTTTRRSSWSPRSWTASDTTRSTLVPSALDGHFSRAPRFSTALTPPRNCGASSPRLPSPPTPNNYSYSSHPTTGDHHGNRRIYLRRHAIRCERRAD